MSSCLITLTGPSGSGKSTMEKELVENGGCNKLVSFTTRNPREGEVNAVDYHFISKADVETGFDPEDFVEKIELYGNYYGLLVDEVKNKLADTDYFATVVVVDPHGVEQLQDYAIKNNIPIISVYINNPKQLLVERIMDRANKDKAENRAKHAQRIIDMLKDEYSWYADNPNLYDLHIPMFDKDNYDEVILDVLDIADMYTGGSRE